MDVAVSAGESTLEAPAAAADAPGAALHAVRLGLDRVGGLSADASRRIVAARAQAPFTNPEDLARRALLDARDLQALAQADALKSLAGHRFEAAWAVAGIDARPTPMLRQTRVHETVVVLPAPA